MRVRMNELADSVDGGEANDGGRLGCVYWSTTRLRPPAAALHREVGIIRERVVA